MSNRKDFSNVNSGSIVDDVTAPVAETIPEDESYITATESDTRKKSNRVNLNNTDNRAHPGETIVDDEVPSQPAYAAPAGKNRRVVGWLVGITGACKGMDYRLHEGKNYIGRDSRCEVNVEDMKVSAGNVAQIVFDPRSKIFFSSDCDGTGTLSYLNGAPLMGRSTLKIYDRIEVGNSTLLFVPLCGETFSWDDNTAEK